MDETILQTPIAGKHVNIFKKLGSAGLEGTTVIVDASQSVKAHLMTKMMIMDECGQNTRMNMHD